MLYDRLAGLDLQIDGYEFDLLERETTSDFTRTTTVVSLHGDGHTGRGEDVTYDSDPHYELQDWSPSISLTGTYSFPTFAEELSGIDFFDGTEPSSAIFRNYRRWAFESAALDLALKQTDTDLASVLDRSYDPVRFVVSTRISDMETGTPVPEWLERDPTLEFKLDPTAEWTPALIESVAETGAVRILDLKGTYEGTDVDAPGDPELYERLLEAFPDVIFEDPDLTAETRPLFDDHEDRVSWDYPIRGVETVEQRPFEPQWLNIKPSRFGSVESLLDTIEYCQKRGVRLYGGGQFELGVGREQLHAFASLFYPNSPNDVAPGGYNVPEPPETLPESPLSPPTESIGLEWR